MNAAFAGGLAGGRRFSLWRSLLCMAWESGAEYARYGHFGSVAEQRLTTSEGDGCSHGGWSSAGVAVTVAVRAALVETRLDARQCVPCVTRWFGGVKSGRRIRNGK